MITLSQDGDLGRMEALNAAVSSLTAHGAIQTDYVAPPDPASIESIEAFQAASGIIVDGQIGPDTQAAIDIAETQGGPTFANVSGNDMQLVAATLNAALPGAVLNAAAGPGGE